MHIVSVNVSQPQAIPFGKMVIQTGIFKKAIAGHVMLHQHNLDGDGQADLSVHGGEYKAVYAYPYEHYATWQAELKRDDFEYGQFGENFTTTGLVETEVYIGNVYRIGAALVQVTQPRVPCFKLGIRMNDPSMVKRFMQAQRTGFYLRVLEAGMVGADDTITLETEDAQQLSVQAINHLLYFEPDMELAEKALKIDSLAPGWRTSLEDMLAQV
jgi:MOSC domain-containing protein YiiM